MFGYTTLSIGCLFFFIASLPEIIDSVIQSEGLNEENDSLKDKASGIFNGFVALGAIIAPILGGVLSDSVGYRTTNDIMAVTSSAYTLAFALSYFLAPKPKFPRVFSVMDKKRAYSQEYMFKSVIVESKAEDELDEDNSNMVIKEFSKNYINNS